MLYYIIYSIDTLISYVAYANSLTDKENYQDGFIVRASGGLFDYLLNFTTLFLIQI